MSNELWRVDTYSNYGIVFLYVDRRLNIIEWRVSASSPTKELWIEMECSVSIVYSTPNDSN